MTHNHKHVILSWMAPKCHWMV